MKKLFTTILIAVSAQLASAAGLESLELFMAQAQAGQADFTQVVTSPAKDGKAGRSKTSSGTFAFQRPGRFKFVYQKPFEQTIVADGQTLWLYDVDLNQVTQRAQAQVLGSTPAALLTSAANLKRCAPNSPSNRRRQRVAWNGCWPAPKAKTARCKVCALVLPASNWRRWTSSTALASAQ